MRLEEIMPKFAVIAAAVATLLCAAVHVRADESAEDVKAAAAKVKDPALRDHLLQNVDIFGKNDLPAIYILMPGVGTEEDIRGSLLTRDFSRDPFFMQNVDREEFEMKMTLREFSDEDNQQSKKKDETAARR
jgi:hypothetical protein